MKSPKLKVVIAGASGFIGKWFIKTFHDKYDIIALTRKEVVESRYESVTWRLVDLYSLSSTISALREADIALYLVHSMSPSSALNQASFEDTDLLLADNFRQAAEINKLQQILYVGGILPKDKSAWSRHLISRYEVEETLSKGKVPITALRAGIIIGPGGSSFQILERLVKNLPVMACPKWTQTNCQPIDIKNLLEIVDQSITNERAFDKAIEIGGSKVITYRQLIELTAKASGKKRLLLNVPFFTIGLSKLWVSLFTRTSPTFISPLVESLKHEMTFDKTLQNDLYNLEEVDIFDSISKALFEKVPTSAKRKRDGSTVKNVRSVQRISNKRGLSVSVIASRYFIWLNDVFRPFIKVKEITPGEYDLRLLGMSILKLSHQETKKSNNREVFFIVGGALAKRTDLGWLEFRSVLGNSEVLTAIHEYVPKLPWTLYKVTQAQVHLWVMRMFSRTINR